MNGNQTQQPEAPTTETETKLDPALKAKWITALRSGEYKQTTSTLCIVDVFEDDHFCHCCLGVLAEVAGVPRSRLIRKPSLDEIDRKDLLGGWYPETRDKEGNPVVSLQRQLAAMNDSGKSFAQIADWIEANL